VTVEHSVDVKRLEEIALRWAGELGVDPAKIMGPNRFDDLHHLRF
jgi:hypothetical protein